MSSLAQAQRRDARLSTTLRAASGDRLERQRSGPLNRFVGLHGLGSGSPRGPSSRAPARPAARRRPACSVISRRTGTSSCSSSGTPAPGLRDHRHPLDDARSGLRRLPDVALCERGGGGARCAAPLARHELQERPGRALPYGGGKAVIIGDPRHDKSPALFEAFGRVVQGLGGRYITAEDVGTSVDDMRSMRRVSGIPRPRRAPPARRSRHRLGRVRGDAGSRRRIGRTDVTGLQVAVQGLGNVGMTCAAICTRPARGSSSPTSIAANARRPSALRRAPSSRRTRFSLRRPSCSRPARSAACSTPGPSRRSGRVVVGPPTTSLPRGRPRAAARARHPLRAGLRHQCRRRYRFPPGADRRPAGGGAGGGRADPRRDLDVLKRAQAAGVTPLTLADRMVARRLQRRSGACCGA